MGLGVAERIERSERLAGWRRLCVKVWLDKELWLNFSELTIFLVALYVATEVQSIPLGCNLQWEPLDDKFLPENATTKTCHDWPHQDDFDFELCEDVRTQCFFWLKGTGLVPETNQVPEHEGAEKFCECMMATRNEDEAVCATAVWTGPILVFSLIAFISSLMTSSLLVRAAWMWLFFVLSDLALTAIMFQCASVHFARETLVVSRVLIDSSIGVFTLLVIAASIGFRLVVKELRQMDQEDPTQRIIELDTVRGACSCSGGCCPKEELWTHAVTGDRILFAADKDKDSGADSDGSSSSSSSSSSNNGAKRKKTPAGSALARRARGVTVVGGVGTVDADADDDEYTCVSLAGVRYLTRREFSRHVVADFDDLEAGPASKHEMQVAEGADTTPTADILM